MMNSSWFDVRVFYLRISNYGVDESTPDHLTVNHHALEHDTILEVNGRSGNNSNGRLSSSLRRDRADKRTEEATFVSTDKIRVTGSVRFEIFHDNGSLFSGILELISNDESKNSLTNWRIGHLEITNDGAKFLKGTKRMDLEFAAPTVDVYVAGCFDRSPVILAKTLRLGIMLSHHHRSMMNHPTELRKGNCSDDFQWTTVSSDQMAEDESDIDINGLLFRGKHLHDDDDVELSWFNAGVRVGVGIGLGVSLGVGIGVGLMVRAYKLTLGQLRR